MSGDFNRVLEVAAQKGRSQTGQLQLLDAVEVDDHVGPGGSTLSKARYKLDLFLMLCRQEQWLEEGLSSRWVSLCF